MSARVLHVVEAYGGGVASAIHSYVRSTPDVEHHLLRHVRSGDFVEGGESSVFASVSELSPGPFRARSQIRYAVRRIGPDVIHAHSSLAGAYVRSMRLPERSRGMRVVYTPHCYAFERADLTFVQRSAFALAESLMARRTDVVAACSEREAQIARRLRNSQPAVWVPNVAGVEAGGASEEDRPIQVVASGRLAEQKDPLFFARTARILGRKGISNLLWIGDGEPKYRDALTDSGVHVTGWLPRQQALEQLARAQVYVHTARWEGAPMAILEAGALGIPIVARAIPSLEGSPMAQLAEDPEEMADLIVEVLSDSQAAALNREMWASVLARNTAQEQSGALRCVYGMDRDCEHRNPSAEASSLAHGH